MSTYPIRPDWPVGRATRTGWMRVALALPPAAIAALSMPVALDGGGGAWLAVAILAAFAALVLFEGPGRWLGLMGGLLVAWGGLLFISDLAASMVHPVLGVAFLFGCGLLVTALAWRLGAVWGLKRAARLAERGRGIVEWEWVYVGPEPARVLPWGRWSMGLSVTVGVLALAALGSLWLGVRGHWMLAPPALLDAVAIWAMLRRAPIAYPLVFAALIVKFPLSIPLLVYWADGVRPNLIYRHRFERLVPTGVADVP